MYHYAHIIRNSIINGKFVQLNYVKCKIYLPDQLNIKSGYVIVVIIDIDHNITLGFRDYLGYDIYDVQDVLISSENLKYFHQAKWEFDSDTPVPNGYFNISSCKSLKGFCQISSLDFKKYNIPNFPYTHIYEWKNGYIITYNDLVICDIYKN